MAATVTIDKAYFETLLRRAEFHTSGRDLTTPVDIPIVSIPKVDHDNLLRTAQEYGKWDSKPTAQIPIASDPHERAPVALTDLNQQVLRKHCSLEVSNETPWKYSYPCEETHLCARTEAWQVLIHGGSVPLATTDTFVHEDRPEDGGVNLFSRPPKMQVTMSRLSGETWADQSSNWPPKISGHGGNGYYHRGHIQGKAPSYSRHNSSAQEDDISWDPDLDKDDQGLTVPRIERKRYAREEQRTIIAKNLSDRTTHKDIIDFVRGGLVLDIYLRSNERSASISFVEGSAAQEFMNHVKRNDIYVHGKRLEFSWNERQFVLPGHVANKIGIGATRNLIIRNVHPNITEERLRDDLDHIHNLIVIEMSFQNGDAHLSLNSIHNSLFARTCMMSRKEYKGMKIEWYPDKCAQTLPKTQYIPKKENLAPPPAKKADAMMNRFQMLNMDGDDTEEGSEEGEIVSDLSSLNINRSPWNRHTIAA